MVLVRILIILVLVPYLKSYTSPTLYYSPREREIGNEGKRDNEPTTILLKKVDAIHEMDISKSAEDSRIAPLNR
jgi:hypothetical protein